jgi:hypothetical protein
MQNLPKLLVSILWLWGLCGLLACDGKEPVATQYKKSNPQGAQPASGDTNPDADAGGEGDGGDDAGGEDAGGEGDEGAALQGDPARGETLFTDLTCAGCHVEGGVGPVLQNMTPDDISAAQSNPNHGAVENYPSDPQDLADISAYLEVE